MEITTNVTSGNDVFSLLFAQLDSEMNKTKGTDEKNSAFEQFFELFQKDDELSTKMQELVQTIQSEDSVQQSDIEKLLQDVAQKIEEIETKSDESKTDEDAQTVEEEITSIIQLFVSDVKSKTDKNEQTEQPVDGLPKERGELIENIIHIWKQTKDSSSTPVESKVLNKEGIENNINTSTSKDMVLQKQKAEINQLIKGQADLSDSSKSVLNGQMDVKTTKDEMTKEMKADVPNVLPKINKEAPDEALTKEVKKTDVSNGSSLQVVDSKSQITTMQLPQKHTLHQMVRQEVLNTPTTIKIINPEKIVIQLKPIELGAVQVTIEKIDGEIHVSLKSDNQDVQQLLDGLADDIKEDLKLRDMNDANGSNSGENEQSSQREQEEKTKEEYVSVKKDYEKEDDEPSFEEKMLDMLGGMTNGYSRY